jgi:hypothetical protein
MAADAARVTNATGVAIFPETDFISFSIFLILECGEDLCRDGQERAAKAPSSHSLSLG